MLVPRDEATRGAGPGCGAEHTTRERTVAPASFTHRRAAGEREHTDQTNGETSHAHVVLPWFFGFAKKLAKLPQKVNYSKTASRGGRRRRQLPPELGQRGVAGRPAESRID